MMRKQIMLANIAAMASMPIMARATENVMCQLDEIGMTVGTHKPLTNAVNIDPNPELPSRQVRRQMERLFAKGR
jgi:alkylated DNA nucleotide flippase Atl1